MVLARIVPLTASLVLVSASLAGASPHARRDGHFDGKVATSTVPGGATTVTADLSNDVRSADLYIDTDSTRSQDDFKAMTFALLSAKTKNRRIVACAVMAARAQDQIRELLSGGDGTISTDRIEVFAGNRAAAYALMCMNMARLMAEIEAEGPPARAAARRPKCDVIPVKVKVRTMRTSDRGYTMVNAGGITNGQSALPVRMGCKSTSKRLTVRVTPKKKGPLQKALGPKMAVGVVNPTTADDSVDVTVGFKGH
jgi:hypothetical protein